MTKHLSLLILLAIALTGCNPRANKATSNSSPMDAFKGKKPLIVLDGRPIPQDSSLKQYVTEEEVESIELIENSKKNSKYLNMTYGDVAKDGVIKVATNPVKVETRKALYNNLVNYLIAFEKAPSSYLFVKDGFPIAQGEVKNLRNLASTELKEVVTVSLNAARAIYGDTLAKENTVIINTINMNAK